MTSGVYGHMTKWVRLPNHDKVRKCLNISHQNYKGPPPAPLVQVSTPQNTGCSMTEFGIIKQNCSSKCPRLKQSAILDADCILGRGGVQLSVAPKHSGHYWISCAPPVQINRYGYCRTSNSNKEDNPHSTYDLATTGYQPKDIWFSGR
jgi:hypothetical protein